MAAVIHSRTVGGRWLGSALFAVILVVAVVASQGCCSTWCTNWCERQCPTPAPTDSTFAIAFLEEKMGEPCAAGMCICADPRTVKAGAGDTIRFVNASTVKLTITPYPGVFASDAPFDIEAKDTVEKKIKDTATFGKGAILLLDLEVHPPGNKCEGYPSPSIEWD